MRNMASSFKWAIAAALLALVASPSAIRAADPLTIDVILPMTGPASFSGTAQQQAVQIFERVANKAGGVHGRPVHFQIHDDQSNPIIAVQIVNEILPKKPTVIMGPSIAATCSAVSPLMATAGPVEYCFSPVADPPRGGYVFAISQSIRAITLNEIAHVRALGFRRLAILSANDASGQRDTETLLSGLRDSADQTVKVVAQAQFSPADLSIAAQVSNVKAAQPDIIVLYAIGPAFWMALRHLNGAGLTVPVLTNPANADEDLLKQNRLLLPKTLMITGLPYQAKRLPGGMRAASEEFLNAFHDAGLKLPSRSQADAWDPLKLVIAALRVLPADATPAQLHDYLENLHDFPGLFGIYDFRSHDQHGLALIPENEEPEVRWDVARGEWVSYST
jgi:branched-chain amino acid transport system substrate-binding protein